MFQSIFPIAKRIRTLTRRLNNSCRTAQAPVVSLTSSLIILLIVTIAFPQASNGQEKNSELKRTSFLNDVMPIFMRGGCNGGMCHGSSRGKDGFKLSLFGYDPEGDYYRLIEEHFGRRINLASPADSLLLKKAAGEVPHTGGKIFDPSDKHYRTLLKWIAEGAPRDQKEIPLPIGIEILPGKITFKRPNESIATKVVATYSDNSKRDISDLCLYRTNNEGIATIDSQAKVAGKKAGGTHVFASFDRFTAGTEVVVLPARSFKWNNAPQFNYIDKLVDEKLKELRILPSQVCSDEQFLRRATLDLIGRIPTPKEYEDFQADSSKNKRQALIDRLLEQDDFAHLWAAKWGEWLRILTDTNPEKGTAMKAGWNYYHWLRESMLENKPWDKLAEELLTGNGSNFRNPPSNYYTMLPQGKLEPSRLAEDTAQIFLGLRIQCAQCHNHPFDRWTIDDYYSFTSFFTGVRRKHGSEAREYYTFVDVDAEPAKHLVDNRPMPHQFLGGKLADVKNKDARKVLAGWMTHSKNKLFRQNMANRIWDHFFGRGIVHPVDDVRISNPPSNAGLLTELSRKFAEEYQFNPKELVRDICNSRTYQTSASTNSQNRNDDRWFSHAYLRRVRADVMLDSINLALDLKPVFRKSTAERALLMFEGGQHDNYNMYFFSTFGQAKRESVCVCETRTDANLSQSLHLINGATLEKGLQRDPKMIRNLMKSHTDHDVIIKTIYIRVLSRKPSRDELEKIIKLAPQSENQRELEAFYSSVAWSLLNSHEFMFNH